MVLQSDAHSGTARDRDVILLGDTNNIEDTKVTTEQLHPRFGGSIILLGIDLNPFPPTGSACFSFYRTHKGLYHCIMLYPHLCHLHPTKAILTGTPKFLITQRYYGEIYPYTRRNSSDMIQSIMTAIMPRNTDSQRLIRLCLRTMVDVNLIRGKDSWGRWMGSRGGKTISEIKGLSEV